MKLLILFCCLLGLGSAWNQPSTCYVRQPSCTNGEASQAILDAIQETLAIMATALTQLAENQFEIQEVKMQLNVLQEQCNECPQGASNTTRGALTCEELSASDYANITVTPGPNLLSRGLGSVATYHCDPGYALVGQTTRTCEDTSGGTVTTGTWSGTPPTCQKIYCLELSAPASGNVTISSEPLVVGTTANYSCDSDYVLVGEVTRTCEDADGRTVGAWSGSMPMCQEIIRCEPLTPPTDGVITISLGTYGVDLGEGAIATYSWDTGYGLIGQATRDCEIANAGPPGTWSGSEPTCQEVVLCPFLPSFGNGTITYTAGADNSNIGVGSVATFSCKLGYVLVGQTTTRECQELSVGTSAEWTGSQPICEEAVYCPALTAPVNGTVSINSGVNYLSVGSTAIYSCVSGYSLIGSSNRTCKDPDDNSVGTWTGGKPTCEVIMCPVLDAPDHGTFVISASSTLLVVGTTATYSCDAEYVLVGDTTRTCEDVDAGTNGEWSGTDPSCAIPNRSLIDCQEITCRSAQLVCPDQDNCTIHCFDSRTYPCFETDIACPHLGGHCMVNCDDSFACLQANVSCPEGGSCTLNCINDNSCMFSNVKCSGDTCLLNCDGRESCSNSVWVCSSDSCTLSCKDLGSCASTNLQCSGQNCLFDCQRGSSCMSSHIGCSGDNCVINCDSSN